MTLLRHLSGYAPVKIAATLAAFGGIYAFTRLLGPEEYGRYALMFSVMALVHLLTLTWVEAASYRFGGEVEDEKQLQNHFRTALTLLGLSLILATIFGLSLFWMARDHPNYQAFLPYIALLLPLNTIIKIAMEAHRARLEVRRFAMSATAKIVIGFAAGVSLAWQTGLGAVAPFAGLLCGAAIIMLFEGRWVISEGLKGQTDRDQLQAWARYGFPVAFALGLDVLLSSADRFLIAYFMDEAAVGAYAAGYGIADKTGFFLFSWIAIALSPLIMSAYEQEDRLLLDRYFRQFADLLVLIGLPVATGLALVASPLADAMIGEALRDDAKTIIPWVAFAGLLNGFVAIYFTESFNLTKRTKRRAWLMVPPLLINLALNVVLIPKYGLSGAVATTVLSYALALVLMMIAERQLIGLPIPLGTLAKSVFACGLMLPITRIETGLGPWVDLFAMAVTGASIYAIAILALNAGGVRDLLQNWLRRSEA